MTKKDNKPIVPNKTSRAWKATSSARKLSGAESATTPRDEQAWQRRMIQTFEGFELLSGNLPYFAEINQIANRWTDFAAMNKAWNYFDSIKNKGSEYVLPSVLSALRESFWMKRFLASASKGGAAYIIREHAKIALLARQLSRKLKDGRHVYSAFAFMPKKYALAALRQRGIDEAFAEMMCTSDWLPTALSGSTLVEILSMLADQFEEFVASTHKVLMPQPKSENAVLRTFLKLFYESLSELFDQATVNLSQTRSAVLSIAQIGFPEHAINKDTIKDIWRDERNIWG